MQNLKNDQEETNHYISWWILEICFIMIFAFDFSGGLCSNYMWCTKQKSVSIYCEYIIIVNIYIYVYMHIPIYLWTTIERDWIIYAKYFLCYSFACSIHVFIYRWIKTFTWKFFLKRLSIIMTMDKCQLFMIHQLLPIYKNIFKRYMLFWYYLHA